MEKAKIKVNKTEMIIGFIGVLLVLILGKALLKTDMLFFRLLIGVGLGYVLTRAYTGFAGSVNRAYNTGSTKLMRTLMFMFFISTLITTAFVFNSDPSNYNLWINPINLGLILGATLFGFGMSFSSCCASGVLTDLITGLPRAFITLIFFSLGVFLGFPVQKTAKWVTNSWFSTSVGEQMSGGVFLPDLFKGDGLGGYLGALILIALFCSLVVSLSYLYEKCRKNNSTYIGHPMEEQQNLNETFDTKEFNLFGVETYNRFFVKPWTLKQGAVVISLIFALLMGVTGAGWGASTPYGMWFGKLLMIFGVSSESLASFTNQTAEFFTVPFFEHAVSVQNFGIIIGTAIYLLTAGKFRETFMSEMHITKKEVLLFALGGITMGLGTRLANGCNVGALYTPIANFSLSGWIFLIFMVVGGIAGNTFAKKVG
ncbi:YeeE/YedE family protein [Schnuerera sp. xch1]|uniref:YeeE/YedE family protein n=1 Tax=Schnuerera sp. xch1 TaxID=2874283 RepID=UPI001CBE18C9|nr:YeeE/YedE family protein [Schnuerera sp. xch1]MBZ2175017.1 YeeE/YedE family protein [Schnuerera sp. xch1]